MGRLPDDDPLTLALAPPPGETEQEKTLRLKAEEAARIISDRIDDEIREEKAAMKKKKKPIKVLLLGQSESGERCSRLMVTYGYSCWHLIDKASLLL